VPHAAQAAPGWISVRAEHRDEFKMLMEYASTGGALPCAFGLRCGVAAPENVKLLCKTRHGAANLPFKSDINDEIEAMP
jgi:hypothetical protein